MYTFGIWDVNKTKDGNESLCVRGWNRRRRALNRIETKTMDTKRSRGYWLLEILFEVWLNFFLFIWIGNCVVTSGDVKKQKIFIYIAGLDFEWRSLWKSILAKIESQVPITKKCFNEATIVARKSCEFTQVSFIDIFGTKEKIPKSSKRKKARFKKVTQHRVSLHAVLAKDFQKL